MKILIRVASLLLLLIVFNACGVTKLKVLSVSYQSIRNEHTDVNSIIPRDARIVVRHQVSSKGELEVFVQNMTDSIMIIDRTMSFFVNSDGMSTSYYDPNIHTTTTSDMASRTVGATVNLGTVGSALGVNGVAGRILSGVSVGSSSTAATSVSNTIYSVDQPSVAIGPRGQIGMARAFDIEGVGSEFLKALSSQNTTREDIHLTASKADESVAKFSVIISFSTDGGKHFEKISTEYYTDLLMLSNVKRTGKVNSSLRDILHQPDVLRRGWNIIYFHQRPPIKVSDVQSSFRPSVYQSSKVLFDYK